MCNVRFVQHFLDETTASSTMTINLHQPSHGTQPLHTTTPRETSTITLLITDKHQSTTTVIQWSPPTVKKRYISLAADRHIHPPASLHHGSIPGSWHPPTIHASCSFTLLRKKGRQMNTYATRWTVVTWEIRWFGTTGMMRIYWMTQGRIKGIFRALKEQIKNGLSIKCSFEEQLFKAMQKLRTLRLVHNLLYIYFFIISKSWGSDITPQETLQQMV